MGGNFAPPSVLSTGFKNKLIGGNFDTNPWQRGTSFSFTATAYTADRWHLFTTRTIATTKTADAPTISQTGFFAQNCLGLVFTGANTAAPVSTEIYGVAQSIEGYEFATIAQQPFTVSFWVKSAKTGIFTLASRSGGNDRSCVMDYTVNAANTWERKVVTFPATPFSGTWNYTNGTGLFLFWTLAAGPAYNAPSKGVWATGDYLSSADQVNWFDTQNASFNLALVQCEVGTVATPFEQRSVGQEIALCQRYFAIITPSIRFNATAGPQFAANGCPFPVRMRATPTAALLNAPARQNAQAVTLLPYNNIGARFNLTSSAAGDCYAVDENWTLNAEL